MQTITGLFHGAIDLLQGLGGIVKTAWMLWAKLFSGLPYGDPWIAAVALTIVLVIIDRIVRPRQQYYG